MAQMADGVSRLMDSDEIHLSGDYVSVEEWIGKSRVVPLPPQLNEFLRGYDVIVIGTHLRGFFYPKPASQKWVLYEHSWMPGAPELKFAADFDSVIALSEIHRQRLAASGIPLEKINVISNGIDPNIFKPGGEKRNPRSLMYAGALVRAKQVHILLEAFRSVRARYADAELHIYGAAEMWHAPDDYESALRQRRDLGVTFHGAVPASAMPEVYRRHSLLCLPSKIESFSLVAIEAQACGCIPVAHRTGGVEATVRNGETGFLYSPNSSQELARTLLLAVDEVALREDMRRRAAEYARSQFALDRSVGLFHRLVTALGCNCHVTAAHKEDEHPRPALSNSAALSVRDPLLAPGLFAAKEIISAMPCVRIACGNLAEHNAEFRAILNRASNSSLALFDRAILEREFRQLESCLKTMLDAPSLRRAAILVLGCIYVSKRQFKEAALFYGEQFRRKPEDTSIVLSLALCFFELGDRRAAMDLFKRVIRHRPGHRVALAYWEKIISTSPAN